MTTDDRPKSPGVDIAPDLLLVNWRGELDAVELYKLLARYERSEERSQILLEMVKDEERHAEVMAGGWRR
ncbi:MAG: hypothetical protein IH866_00770 [Chloroflexi bacterium]|nr:hypothetical protein [Chloroflexota bacterium]